MAEHDNITTIKLVKRNGKLEYLNKGMQAAHEEFLKEIVEGQIIEVFFEGYQDDGTNLQLSKIHPCIRKIANETGMTFEAMKLEIKKKAGLAHGDLQSANGYVKSFADCSKEELSGVIQTIIEVGDFVNINFRGKLPQSDQY